MNLFDGKFILEDGYDNGNGGYKIMGSYTDNTGTYYTTDAQVGDIIYLDGSFAGSVLLRYKITELFHDEYYDSVISATVEWDMESDPVEPFAGMEGIIGALHTNGLTANITASSTNGASEVVIAKAHSYQAMLLGMNSGGGGTPPDLSEVNKKIKNLEDKVDSVMLEWEDNLVFKLT